MASVEDPGGDPENSVPDSRGWAPLDDEGAAAERPAPPAPPPPPPNAPPPPPNAVPAAPPPPNSMPGWPAPPPPPGWQQAPPPNSMPGWQAPPAPGWNQGPPGWQPPRPLPKAGDARTGPLPMHPMTVGDVLDGAFKLFKANARTVVLVTAAVVVPVQLVSSFALRGQFETGLLSIFRDPTIAESVAQEQDSIGQALVTLATAIVSLLVTPFIAGAVARVVATSYLGREITPAEALRHAARQFPALLASFILVHLLEFVGFLLCVLPAFAVMTMYVLVAPAIAVEELGPIQAMRRSWNLVKPRFWPVLGISLLVGFIANTLGQILGTLPALLAIVIGGSFAWLVVAVSGVLTSLVSVPIVTIAATLLYFDARIRHEGFDLQIMAGELAAHAPAHGGA